MPRFSRAELEISTSRRAEFVNVTSRLQELANRSGWTEGTLTVFVPHTTAGITIQEGADPDVVHDLLGWLEGAVPWTNPLYRHGEGNTAAHIKAALMGSSIRCLLEAGRLHLGTWQAIFFCEFDGPRSRRLWVSFEPTSPG
ncbi:secondary thiamine-phosphate synthase enzyme YjbQ [Methylacidimicrobium cyclopophantes]|uniref:secondary thiamine-phosphate synthase enzyme YjbQ n=1 Tax=Methylacidimicrobium cyclopophantes TaxID=1041766 RepID=UPI001FE33A7A|nr:secondary thiamine-phosphate synthase enzyme YjbQ [Methylacidimicrobium cyclopophantes]